MNSKQELVDLMAEHGAFVDISDIDEFITDLILIGWSPPIKGVGDSVKVIMELDDE